MHRDTLTITQNEIGTYLLDRLGPFLRDTANCLKGFNYKGRVERSPNGKYTIPLTGKNKNYIGLDVKSLTKEYLCRLDEHIDNQEEVTLYCIPRFQSTSCGGIFYFMVRESECFEDSGLCELNIAIESLNKSKINRMPFPRLDKLKKVSIIYTTEDRVLQDFLKYTACFIDGERGTKDTDTGFKFALQEFVIKNNPKPKDIVELINRADGDVIVLIRGGGYPDSINIPYAPIVASALLAKQGKYRLVGIGHSDNLGIGDLVMDNFAITPTDAGVILRDEIQAQLTALKVQKELLREHHEKATLQERLDDATATIKRERGAWGEERKRFSEELSTLRHALSQAEKEKEKLVRNILSFDEEKKCLQRENESLQSNLTMTTLKLDSERCARREESSPSSHEMAKLHEALSRAEEDKAKLAGDAQSLIAAKERLEKEIVRLQRDIPKGYAHDSLKVYRQNTLLKLYICLLSMCLLIGLYYNF